MWARPVEIRAQPIHLSLQIVEHGYRDFARFERELDPALHDVCELAEAYCASHARAAFQRVEAAPYGVCDLAILRIGLPVAQVARHLRHEVLRFLEEDGQE